VIRYDDSANAVKKKTRERPEGSYRGRKRVIEGSITEKLGYYISGRRETSCHQRGPKGNRGKGVTFRGDPERWDEKK